MEQERKELLNNESEDRAKNKTGLVLEGGGMRGIYTAGVLDVFLDEGLEFDGVIGVSAGAVHGCSFLSGQRGRSIRYYKKYCADKRFMSAENMIRTGNFVDTDFCYHELPEVLDPYDYEAFDRNKEKTDFYVVCSDVEKGTPVYAKLHDMKKDIDYIRASASLPYVSKFVELGGRKLLDGGCTDSVPVEAFMKLGFTKDVVVLTRDLEYRKKPENAWMADLMYRKYPKFAEVLKNRSVEYNRSIRRIENLEKEGKIFVIRPSVPLTISRTSRSAEEIEKTYQVGVLDAKKQMAALKEWLDIDKKDLCPEMMGQSEFPKCSWHPACDR